MHGSGCLTEASVLPKLAAILPKGWGDGAAVKRQPQHQPLAQWGRLLGVGTVAKRLPQGGAAEKAVQVGLKQHQR
jgi:hypothetical protein